jgi:hypothetical protein
MNKFFEQITVIALAIIGIAIVATVVSNRATTQGIIRNTGIAFVDALSAATGPVTGGGFY